VTYIPERGDAVWLDFSPQVGHEQAGRRPAFVLSPQTYNRRVGLVIVCPITSRIKGYPFEVTIPDQTTVRGVVLADQVRSLDWQGRNVTFIGSLPPRVLAEVLAKLGALLGYPLP
jgi:mRNA interferase MazF